MCIVHQCQIMAHNLLNVRDFSDASTKVAWVTLRGSSFEDGKRLFLSDSRFNPGQVLVEYRANDSTLRVGEIARDQLRSFLNLLPREWIETSLELCDVVWITHPTRPLGGWMPIPAEACSELGV